jgi:4-alpha-glucanotransferase
VSEAEDLDRICRAAGIERVYHDQFGTRHETAPETVRAICAALGVAEAHHPDEPDLLAPTTIVYADDAAPAVRMAVPARAGEAEVGWQVIEESGQRHSFRARVAELRREEHGERAGCRSLPLPPGLAPGYHRLTLRIPSLALEAASALIVAPRRAYLPSELGSGPGIWGFAAQLYALRSERDWGIGDFGTLDAFCARAAAAGAGAVGVNPLHALALDEPERVSPYSPNSRSFLNPLYIDIESAPDFAESAEARDFVASAAFAQERARLRAAPLVDYPGVAALKLRALALLHASFRRRHLAGGGARAQDFSAYCAQEGEALKRFCIFQALRERRGAADPAQRDWRNWPPDLKDPASPAVAAFAMAEAERVEFFAYCQWIARVQLAACAAAARAAGMPVGLYGDLAVGVDAAAGDAWAAQDVTVGGWSLGAPPDAWNRRGQDWGLSPLNPAGLRRQGYRPFAAMIRANMRDFGALRIDHILGFWRCFWIPHGRAPADGAYVRYPFSELVAVLALESQRARCVVVGEDLGTVPEGLREALQAAGILSYRLLYFEHRGDGQRARAQDYPRLALVAVGTHDLPPLAAFWRGSDIALRRALGQFRSDEEAEAERRRRARDRDELAALWRAEGIEAGGDTDGVPVAAAHRFLARTSGRIAMVQLEDALGLEEQANVPGTIDEHPNWRRRLPLPVEHLFEDARVRTLCEALARERPPAGARR